MNIIIYQLKQIFITGNNNNFYTLLFSLFKDETMYWTVAGLPNFYYICG